MTIPETKQDYQKLRVLSDKVEECAMRIKLCLNSGEFYDAFRWHQKLEGLVQQFYEIDGFSEGKNISPRILAGLKRQQDRGRMGTD